MWLDLAAPNILQTTILLLHTYSWLLIRRAAATTIWAPVAFWFLLSCVRSLCWRVLRRKIAIRHLLASDLIMQVSRWTLWGVGFAMAMGSWHYLMRQRVVAWSRRKEDSCTRTRESWRCRPWSNFLYPSCCCVWQTRLWRCVRLISDLMRSWGCTWGILREWLQRRFRYSTRYRVFKAWFHQCSHLQPDEKVLLFQKRNFCYMLVCRMLPHTICTALKNYVCYWIVKYACQLIEILSSVILCLMFSSVVTDHSWFCSYDVTVHWFLSGIHLNIIWHPHQALILVFLLVFLTCFVLVELV